MNLVKKQCLRYLLGIFCMAAISLSGADCLLVESSKLSTINEHLTENVLIVLDIDNTLVESVEELGSDQWTWERIKQLKSLGASGDEALEQTMREWREIHLTIPVKTPEDNAAALIRELQEKGYPIIALTTRGPEDATVTLRELRIVGIDLNHTSIAKHDLEIELKKPALYKNGILFISLFNKKGVALKTFLQKLNYQPQKIIFVDDKLSHIQDVAEACTVLDINYIGIRYGACDQRVKSFKLTN